MRFCSKRVRASMVAAVAAGALTAVPANAGATTLQEPWAPFNQCPVDSPQMLAVQDTGNGCVASVSPHGSFTIGSTTVPTGRTELQFGVTGPAIPDVIPPGFLNAAPSQVPGGLLGIMVPSLVPAALRGTLQNLIDRGPTGVTATVELAGPVHDFSLFAPILGGTIVNLPVKIHLSNPLLGSSCFIGSNANPIVLAPHQDPLATDIAINPDPLGSDIAFFGTTPSPGTLVDDQLAVPAASGCGLLGLLNGAINAKLGLPSPAGRNKLVENDVVATIAGNGSSGQDLHDAWHAAVVG